METEERAQAIAETAATNVGLTKLISGRPDPIDIGGQRQANPQEATKWSLPSDFAWSFGLLTDLGIP